MDIYEPVIAELKAQIEECQRVIVTLEMLRSKGSPTPATPAGSVIAHVGAGISFSNDSFFGMTIADAAKKYLTGIKKTATARAIAEALLAGGFKTAAKAFIESVRSILSKSPSFVLVNGEFGLAEWYPGRKANAIKSKRVLGSEFESWVKDQEGEEHAEEAVSSPSLVAIA
jgi:hypothetical protein